MWFLAGRGWLPAGNLAFHHEGDFPYPPRPDLADAGRIAYVVEPAEVWTMNADGSDRKLLIDVGDGVEIAIQAVELAWSPNGDRLAVTSVEPKAAAYTVRIVDLSGAAVATFQGALLPSWSPGGDRVAFLSERAAGPEECITLPSVIAIAEVAGGAVTPVTSSACHFDGPDWSPDGDSLLYERGGSIYRYSLPDGTETRLLAGSPGGTDAYYTASWSPDSSRAAVFRRQFPAEGDMTSAYEVYVLGEEEPVWSFEDPKGGCGRGAGFSDWQTRWTADGHTLFFSEPCGDAGFSGVWAADVASGRTERIPVEGAGPASPSPDGKHIVFSSGGPGDGPFVWVAHVDGSGLTLLAKGWRPVWQPEP
jgi:Tol biopolymer transport system component